MSDRKNEYQPLPIAKMDFENGERISLSVSQLEFTVGGNTIWVQSPSGSTLLRIKCKGKISVESCDTSPTSHSDIMVEGDIKFCISGDAE